MASELNTRPPGEDDTLLGTDSDPGSSSESTGSIPEPYVPRRGPVLISSDEESEPKLTRPQVFRALSRTPSWAKSSVSPSPPPRGALRPTRFSGPGSDTNSGSNSGSGSRKGGGRSSSARSRSSMEYTGSRGSSGSAAPTTGDSIADKGEVSSRWGCVFESDLEHWPDSDGSVRIRYTKVGSALSPPGSGWGSDSGGDSEEEFDSEEGSPQPGQPPPEQGSISPRESFGEEQHSKSQSPSYRYAEPGSSVEPVTPNLPSEMLDSPSGGKRDASGSDDSGSEFELRKTSRRPGQSSSKRGSDSEGSKSTVSDVGLEPKIRPGGGAGTTMQIEKSEGEKSKKRPHKAKKRTHRLNPDYIKLLNEDIQLVTSRGCKGNPIDSAKAKPLRGARVVMGSVWTLHEKTTLFKYLSIVGKDNLPELARGVGTKSIVECRAYLKALQDGKEDTTEFLHVRSHRGRDFLSVEAAVELSDECVKALELDADHLEYRTRQTEEVREKAKWGDSWLLDSATAEHIEHLYKSKRIKEIRDIAPEAELLNLDAMLDLSGRIFMYGPEENNWTYWGEEPPSIRHTALSDIHTLVVSLTKRLVQTTLFMAMSRLRSMDDKIFRPRSLVRLSDVVAAIDCLGAPRKSKYWVTLPRRLGLKVYMKAEQIRRRTEKNVMPYDEVENYLERIGERRTTADSAGDECSKVNMDSLILSAYEESEPERKVDDGSSSPDDSMDIDDGDPGSGTEDEDGYQFVDDDGRIYRSKPERKRDAIIAILEDKEDAFMEALDQKHSLKAEKKLWQMIGKEPNKPLPNAVQLPEAPTHGSKRAWEVLDWRDGVDYLAPWETIKRRKAGHGEVEEEITEEEEEEEEENKTDTGPIVKHAPTASMSALEVVALQKTETIPREKPATKKKQLVKTKKPLAPVPGSPRKSRVRRQSKAVSGYVSTVENVAESDTEALVREQGDDDSPSDEEHGDG